MSISDLTLTLPKEIICEIFMFLDPSDLAVCCRVKKLWNQLASNNSVWCYFANVYLGLNPSPTADCSIKNMLSKVLCLSNEQIIKRLQGFLDRCSLEQNCRFRCILGSGKGYAHITVEIKRNDDDPEIAMQESYFAPKGIGDGKLQPVMASIQDLDNEGFLDSFIPPPHVFTVKSHAEPDYATSPPKEKQYREFIWRIKGGTSLKVSTPHSGDIDSATPLETKIEHMLVGKANGITFH